jgi:magnesium-transporting ATPase (P-type)
LYHSADDIENELVIDAVLGIKDPLRPDVKEAVGTFRLFETSHVLRMLLVSQRRASELA